MKRLWLASALAIILHLFVLGLGLKSDRTLPKPRPVPSSFSLTLDYRKPVAVPTPKPEVVEEKKRPLPGPKPKPVPTPPLLPRQEKAPSSTPADKEKAARLDSVVPESRDDKEADVPPKNEPVQELPRTLVKADPLYAVNPPPRYPRLARKRGWQGTVLLAVFVDANGWAKQVKVDAGSNFTILDEAALKAVRKWRFSPGQKNGKPVAMWVRVPVRFTLQQAR